MTLSAKNLPLSLCIQNLIDGYQSGTVAILDVLDNVLESVSAEDTHCIWIRLVATEMVRDKAKTLSARWEKLDRQHRAAEMPLYGVPFAVKDNIDVAGMPTTAGCPEYAYVPTRSATVVTRLEAAGAVLIGKTNMDQFATGLTGTRSPYGPCKNAFDPKYISGGSSAGSGVAVARGLVSFALGTDTAGSGRVPAALNNVVGLKPSRGLVSTAGVVPACRSLDCVSIFANNCLDAAAVLKIIAGPDGKDCFCRRHPPANDRRLNRPIVFAIPDDLEFFGDRLNAQLFERAVQQMVAMGGTAVQVDYTPFKDAARLLYDGPWVAERWAALEAFISTQPEAVHPVVSKIIREGKKYSAADAFKAAYYLQDLRYQSDEIFSRIDFLMVPTVPTIYTIDVVGHDPVGTNKNLGYYTNFVNLLDLAAIAVPSGFRTDGLPFGVSLIGPALDDNFLLSVGGAFQDATAKDAKSTVPLSILPKNGPSPPETVPLAVVGAHLSGLALNHELIDIGASFCCQCRTAPVYRLFHLPKTTPPKPGLVRVATGGQRIDIEVWRVPLTRLGAFIMKIPAPLGIGTLLLDDGQNVKGFICEGSAADGARDITAFGGWRQYIAQCMGEDFGI
ncbi:MAG: allophanate hydrolase [Pseudomonadota bacterium]